MQTTCGVHVDTHYMFGAAILFGARRLWNMKSCPAFFISPQFGEADGGCALLILTSCRSEMAKLHLLWLLDLCSALMFCVHVREMIVRRIAYAIEDKQINRRQCFCRHT